MGKLLGFLLTIFLILDNEHGLFKWGSLCKIEVNSDIHRAMLFGGLGVKVVCYYTVAEPTAFKL